LAISVGWLCGFVLVVDGECSLEVRVLIKTLSLALAALLATPALALAAISPSPPALTAIHYGANPEASATFTHEGVRLYYEVYGQGEPLLLIHGNSASIGTMAAQIRYFRTKYRVIAMDSRDHGRSGDAPGPLTFEDMSDDLAALLDHLHAGPAYVLGWSDGGIEALLLGIRHPDTVKKIAAMAANIEPDGVYAEVLALFAAPPPAKSGAPPSPAAVREARVEALDRDEPHIKPEALESITAPTLILASDHDAIRDEHTLEIYHHIPNSQLAIFPDATHMIPYDDPVRFNATVDRFFSTPFVKKDRVRDLVKSYLKMTAELDSKK
jgi:pimeloyl-ACP methyl ester carboxylesterase